MGVQSRDLPEARAGGCKGPNSPSVSCWEVGVQGGQLVVCFGTGSEVRPGGWPHAHSGCSWKHFTGSGGPSGQGLPGDIGALTGQLLVATWAKPCPRRRRPRQDMALTEVLWGGQGDVGTGGAGAWNPRKCSELPGWCRAQWWIL